MPRFVVQRHLPGVTPDAVKAAGMRAKTCCSEMQTEGTDVRWIRSFYLPESDRTYCVFDAPTRDLVVEANERAQIPFEGIAEAVEMTPEHV